MNYTINTALHIQRHSGFFNDFRCLSFKITKLHFKKYINIYKDLFLIGGEKKLNKLNLLSTSTCSSPFRKVKSCVLGTYLSGTIRERPEHVDCDPTQNKQFEGFKHTKIGLGGDR